MDPLASTPQTTPPMSPVNTEHSPTLRIVGIVLVVAVACLFLFWFFMLRQAPTSNNFDPIIISQDTRAGDYNGAVDAYKQYTANNALTPNKYALATVNVFEALYKANGDVNDVLEGVQDLKNAFAGDISPYVRAQIIMALASAYNDTGENLAVYNTVYADEPFKSHVASSRSHTLRNMMTWAFDVYPNSRAAISIAGAYINNALGRKHIPSRVNRPDDTAESIVKAKEFLKQSDTLVLQEIAADPEFSNTSRYAAQKFWRVFVIGSTVYLGDTEYKNTYAQEYESFILQFSTEGHAEAKQYVPFAYWNYAIALSAVDKNEAKAKEQIAKLMAFVNADPKKEVSEFTLILKNEVERRQQEGPNYNSVWFDHFMNTIPEFKVFVSEIQSSGN